MSQHRRVETVEKFKLRIAVIILPSLSKSPLYYDEHTP
jgi:hypothetical protein